MYMSMSADPSCLGLDGPQTGPLTMELTTGEYCYFKKGKKETEVYNIILESV